MKNKRNYYRILHVQPDAPVELIKMSYRTIMQKLKKHPDLGGDEWDASVINEAYAVLSDKKLRAAYDARLLRERTMADAGQQNEDQRHSGNSESKAKTKAKANPQEKTTSHAETEQAQKQAEQSQKRQGHASAEERASEKSGSERDYSANDEQAPANSCFFCKTTYNINPGIDSDCIKCRSPLLTLSPDTMEQSGDRAIQRQPRNSPLDVWPFWPGEKQQAMLVDLSLHGLKLRFTHPLHAGHLIKVENPAFTGVARVAHCVGVDNGFLLGAQFLSLRFVSQSGTFVQTSA
ncbi:MAG: DnaJ domain-containing protein [Pseudomonadota bacterium]